MAITKIVDDMRTTVALDATKLSGNIDGTKISGAIPTGSLGNAVVDTSVLEYNVAMLAFKHASQNQITKFAMVDQMVDEYQDATGIDTGASTYENAGGTGNWEQFLLSTAGSTHELLSRKVRVRRKSLSECNTHQ